MTTDTRTAPPGTARPLGRLERRKARTRAAILESATRLFTEIGYVDTSMQDVARAADVGVGTLYGYFESKEDLFRAVLADRSRAAAEAHRARVRPDMPVLERVVDAVRAVADYVRNERRLLETAFAVRHKPSEEDEVFAAQLHKELSDLIEKGQREGTIGQVPASSTASVLLSSAALGMLHLGSWSQQADDDQIMRDLEQITRQLLRT